MTSGYNAKDLRVLEGLNAVRKRPGMYIGSTDTQGLMHCLFEILDNSIDEALAGFCDHIEVFLFKDGSVEISDNGRGIPVDIEKTTKLSGVEVVLTKLHAGGKFGQGAYRKVGGLHGVGASVVNALSEQLTVWVKRNSKVYRMSFKRGKKLTKELQVVGQVTKRDTGTRIRFWPDREIFTADAEISLPVLTERLQQSAYLVPQLKLDLTDLRSFPAEEVSDPAMRAQKLALALAGQAENSLTQTFYSPEGLSAFVESIAEGTPINPVWTLKSTQNYRETIQLVDANNQINAEEVERSLDIAIGFQYTNAYESQIKSFVNIVATPFGGTHLQGFEQGLVKAFREIVQDNARKLKLTKTTDKIEKEDVFSGLFAIVTVALDEPQFEGQTKETLGTPMVRKMVADFVYESLQKIMTSQKRLYKPYSGAILDKIVAEMRSRLAAKAHKELLRNKNRVESSNLPAKLVECSSNDNSETELFIVEGDSALGTAKLARDAQFQALLPIRGKILNVQKASLGAMLENQECSAIIQTIGGGSGSTFDLDAARYNKIIIMTDADTDGSHIRILLLTLFYRYLNPLIAQGRIYAAVPPLHRLELTNGEFIYTYSETELDQKIRDLTERHIAFKDDIQRYKGLGEMDANQLAETTMDPKFRSLRRITLQNAASAVQFLALLMGDEVAPRRDFIVKNSPVVDYAQIDA
jgi:DNA gyrase subunit B